MTDIASTNVVCPHCNAVNRVPSSRLADGPNCGRCRQALFTGKPVDLDTERFDAQVQRSDVPLLVDFWAPWCGPCVSMAPQFAQAAVGLEPAFRLGKVDTEANQALAGRFGIRSIPTLMLFRGGREIARQPGAMGAADIARWARSVT